MALAMATSAQTLSAMKTGIAMTLSVLAAVIVAYIITDSDIIKQIMLILMIGSFFDLFYTWIQNAGILRWYIERKTQSYEPQT